MVWVASQEAFDEAVKENVEVFEMSPEEATDEAIQQFKAQGVDLTNIITSLYVDSLTSTEKMNIETILKHIGNFLNKEDQNQGKIEDLLDKLLIEVEIDIAHKVLAGKQGAYGMLVILLERFEQKKSIVMRTLQNLISLMTGQPDLLEKCRGIPIILHYLDNQTEYEIQTLVLKWIKQCCIKHETNRQDLFEAGIVKRLYKILNEENMPCVVIKAACAVVRALVQDDDLRVQYGKAHEHARLLALSCLDTICTLFKKFENTENTVGDIMVTLITILVRNEFCQQADEAGVITCIMNVMVEFHDHEKLNRQSIRLIKSLAGNDDVKKNIIQLGFAELLIRAIDRHRSSARMCSNGCATLGTLALRNELNSKSLCDAGAANTIIECMKAHKKDPDVQKQACWAIRNIVSRDKDLVDGFLLLGAEEHINDVLKRLGSLCDYDAKGALRDLGLKVILDEQWTGKLGSLEID